MIEVCLQSFGVVQLCASTNDTRYMENLRSACVDQRIKTSGTFSGNAHVFALRRFTLEFRKHLPRAQSVAHLLPEKADRQDVKLWRERAAEEQSVYLPRSLLCQPMLEKRLTLEDTRLGLMSKELMLSAKNASSPEGSGTRNGFGFGNASERMLNRGHLGKNGNAKDII